MTGVLPEIKERCTGMCSVPLFHPLAVEGGDKRFLCRAAILDEAVCDAERAGVIDELLILICGDAPPQLGVSFRQRGERRVLAHEAVVNAVAVFSVMKEILLTLKSYLCLQRLICNISKDYKKR